MVKLFLVCEASASGRTRVSTVVAIHLSYIGHKQETEVEQRNNDITFYFKRPLPVQITFP
jgi:hypothetical protein